MFRAILMLALATACAGLWAEEPTTGSATEPATESPADEPADPRPRSDAARITRVEDRGLRWDSAGFSVALRTSVQFRLSFRDERANGNDGTNGRDYINFNLPRVKTGFSGHIFEDMFTYQLRLNWVRGASEMLEVAHFRVALFQAVNLNGGQDKVPFSWEESSEAESMNFMERSYANEVFNQDYGKGIWVDGMIGDDVPWVKYWAGVFNGVLASQEDFRNKDGALTADAFSDVIDNEVMVALRLETHPLGEVWQGLRDDRDNADIEDGFFAVGVGFNWIAGHLRNADLRGDTAAASTGSGRTRTRQSTLAFTLDGHMRWYGISVDWAVFYRRTDFSNVGLNTFKVGGRESIGELEDMGASLEVGYNFPWLDVADIFVGLRFSLVNADEFWGRDAGLRFTRNHQRAIRPDSTEYGLTAAWRLHGDSLKLSMDIVFIQHQLAWSYNNSGSLLGVYDDIPERGQGGLGSNPSSADLNTEMHVRFQLQWMF